jgi:single-strand selective monofunctional uracil DNA glycosylase
MSQDLIAIARELSRGVSRLSFGSPVSHVYNPLEYAWEAHATYLKRFGQGAKEVVLLGMNPGPWGMAQTGVPFGEVGMVRDWLGITEEIARPPDEHPKRPVMGFDCRRSEVSGRRLWGWARRLFETPERFFGRFLIANYCPLLFLESSGRNRTPDRLPAAEQAPLLSLCDAALRRSVLAIRPEWVIGVGKFAQRRAAVALEGTAVRVGGILHPSPASPAANRDWQGQAMSQLAALGIDV